MVGAFSHELRTPINGILNFIRSAMEHPSVTNFIKNEFLRPTEDLSEYLLNIVNDILTFT